jgi:hypothetical protein
MDKNASFTSYFMKQLLLFFAVFTFFSCSNKYKIYQSQYQFYNPSGKPVCSELDYWASHPWKKDPADSLPDPLVKEVNDSLVDVFFIHPTTHTKRSEKDKLNASITDSYINAKTDYTSILYQASVFNQHARVFAPRYRQAHLKAFLMRDKKVSAQAFDLAYSDIRTAFQYYLSHWNKQRPIIIAAHSQGSFLAERLLKEFFENKSLQGKLVVAYLAGWPVPKNYFSKLAMCVDSFSTGCICSWRTLKRGFIPYYYKKENNSSFATNPLSWTTTEEYIPRDRNKGSVLGNFSKIYPGTTDAQLHGGFLWVNRPKFPGSFLLRTRNYHIGDINLYYMNIRENVEQRIRSYFKTRQTSAFVETQ